MQLKGFERITLKPGEKRTVTFTVNPETLSILNIDMHRVVEPGVFDMIVGPSSDKTSTVKLTVTGASGETGKPAATASVPVGSETNMVSNFDEGKVKAAYGMWIPASDTMNGGKSNSKLDVVEPGAANTKGALQVTGTTLSNFDSHAPLFNAGKTVGLDVNNAANTFTVSQVLNQNAGGLTKLGVGKLLLTGSNTYTGVTTLSGGTLQIGNGGIGASISQSSSIVLSNNSDLIFNNADNTSFAQGISGAGNLAKVGTGTLALSGTCIYSGATTVNAGTLVVSGTLSGSATTVNSGGTLAGDNGTLGAVTVNSGGTLSPGVNSVGSLNTGTLTFAAGGVFKFEVNSDTPALDSVSITGDLTIASGVVMNVSDFGATPFAGEILGASVLILDYSGACHGTFEGLPDGSIFTIGLNTYQIYYAGADPTNTTAVTLTILAVPEPGAAVSLLGGLGILLGARRRRA